MISREGVALSPLDSCHAERTRAWMNDPELARLLGRARPVSDREHAGWFAELPGRSDCLFFAVLTCPEREHIGNAWLWDIEPRHGKAEVRIVLGEAAHVGRGLGSQAIRLACAYAFERLNLRKLIAYVLDINPRGRRAFEKAGFQLEAVLRADRWAGDRYADVFLLTQFRDANGQPRP